MALAANVSEGTCRGKPRPERNSNAPTNQETHRRTSTDQSGGYFIVNKLTQKLSEGGGEGQETLLDLCWLAATLKRNGKDTSNAPYSPTTLPSKFLQPTLQPPPARWLRQRQEPDPGRRNEWRPSASPPCSFNQIGFRTPIRWPLQPCSCSGSGASSGTSSCS